MKKDNWKKRIEKIRQWAEDQEESDNLSAILLTIQLGDGTSTDDLRKTYWEAIRSLGAGIKGFPLHRDGGLRKGFEKSA